MPSNVADGPNTRWTRYGLRGNPFFTNALDPDENALYPIRLFVGRESEVQALEQLASSNDRSATLLYAVGGYGKTTLACRIAHDLKQTDFLVLPEELQLAKHEPSLRFFRDVLSGILQALDDDGHKVPDPPHDAAKAKSDLERAKLLVQTTRHWAGGGSGGGAFGFQAEGNVQLTFLTPAFEPGASKRLLEGVAREVASLDYAGILVRLNDMDSVCKTDPDILREFLQDARNLLQVPGIHYVMMGDPDVHQAIEGIPRVRGCFDQPVPLPALTALQVIELIEERYQHLKTGEFVPPVSTSLIEALYKVHHGDLRSILADLGRSIQMVNPIEARPISPEEALPVLRASYLASLGASLTEELWETLRLFTELGDEVRQVDVKQRMGGTAPMWTDRFQRLQQAGAIEFVRQEGASKYFRLTGAALLVLGGAAPPQPSSSKA